LRGSATGLAPKISLKPPSSARRLTHTCSISAPKPVKMLTL
jgi:hypothetical protein